MGKSIPNPASFQRLTRLITSNKINKARTQLQPVSKPVSSPSGQAIQPLVLGQRKKSMEMGNSNSNSSSTLPLSEVVSDCVRRWFEDTLKEAESGDSAMQVLVGQMYYSGYGVPKNAHKGKEWIERASRKRSSALKVGDKQPGYNVSDSDSDEEKVKGN